MTKAISNNLNQTVLSKRKVSKGKSLPVNAPEDFSGNLIP